MGFIPKFVVDSLLENGVPKYKLKKCVAQIQDTIMSVNIDIWKFRCKILYANRNNNQYMRRHHNITQLVS